MAISTNVVLIFVFMSVPHTPGASSSKRTPIDDDGKSQSQATTAGGTARAVAKRTKTDVRIGHMDKQDADMTPAKSDQKCGRPSCPHTPASYPWMNNRTIERGQTTVVIALGLFCRWCETFYHKYLWWKGPLDKVMVREDVDADVEVAKPKFGTPGHPQSLFDEPRGPAPSDMYKAARLGSEAYVIMVSLTKEEFMQIPEFEGMESKECKLEQSQAS